MFASRRRLGFAKLALLLLCSNVQPTHSCECFPSGAPVADRIKQAGAVFSGVAVALVLKEESYKDAQGHQTIYPSQRVKFRVSKAWKGVDNDFVWVSSGMGWGECGFPFSLGREYLVWADRAPDGSLSTGLCSGTTESQIRPQMADLGPPMKEFTHDLAKETINCDK